MAQSVNDITSRDKANKFADLATKRVNKAIKDLRLIGNLGNKKNYAYTDEQARKIVKALQKEMDSLKVAFTGGGSEADDGFKF